MVRVVVNGMIPTVGVATVSGGCIVAVTMVDTRPSGRVVSIVVITGIPDPVSVAREVGLDDAPTEPVAVAEPALVRRIALGRGDAPMARVVVETTPLEVTGHTY